MRVFFYEVAERSIVRFSSDKYCGLADRRSILYRTRMRKVFVMRREWRLSSTPCRVILSAPLMELARV